MFNKKNICSKSSRMYEKNDLNAFLCTFVSLGARLAPKTNIRLSFQLLCIFICVFNQQK